MNPYDANTALVYLDKILNDKHIKPENYSTVKEYGEKASLVFKSSLVLLKDSSILCVNIIIFLSKGGFEKMAENNSFDVFQNGFYLSQMIISCTYEGFCSFAI